MNAMVRITPPDGSDWSIDAVAIEDGLVGLVLVFDLAGERYQLTLALDRPDSRTLAQGLLAAGGDGTERTFPKPAEVDGGR